MGRWGWGKGKSIFAQARAIVPLTTPTHLLAHRACWLRRWSSGGVNSRFRPLTGADARAGHPKKHVGASRVPPLPRPPFMVCRGCRRDAVRPLTVTATSAITCFHCYRHRYRHRHRTTATVERRHRCHRGSRRLVTDRFACKPRGCTADSAAPHDGECVYRPFFRPASQLYSRDCGLAGCLLGNDGPPVPYAWPRTASRQLWTSTDATVVTTALPTTIHW